jgi:hypothetical protein
MTQMLAFNQLSICICSSNIESIKFATLVIAISDTFVKIISIIILALTTNII